MKKVMWLCNTPLPEVQKELGVKVCGEGWLQGISEHLRRQENIELHYVFPQEKKRGLYQRQIDRIYFWGFYSNTGDGYELSRERKKLIEKVFTEVEPDIVHIFGTEFAHSLECVEAVADRKKVIVSVQGLISELAKAYTKKIPLRERACNANGKGSLLNEKYMFYRRGINEKAVLQAVSNVIGRTAWDRRCIQKLNPNCRYFYCSETLRQPFYDGKWDVNKMQRHTIYVSQANYPIKGFHVFIEAFADVLKEFPDARVYVAGKKDFLQKENAYGKYINQLIHKYKLKDKIDFLGGISAEEVKEKLLNVHISVMPSLLENSPNSVGEAMMLGTPVVAARVGGIPSLVRNGREAVLYSGHSARRLAEAVKSIFRNDYLAQKLSDNGRTRAQKLYDRERNLKQLLKIYKAMNDNS